MYILNPSSNHCDYYKLVKICMSYDYIVNMSTSGHKVCDEIPFSINVFNVVLPQAAVCQPCQTF